MQVGLNTQSNKSIVDIYYLSNTPSYLYSMMRQDSYVILLSNRNTSDLINEFNNMANTSLTTIEEMAYMYALLIAISLKPLHEIDDFMKGVKKTISFEWFGDIVDIFYNSQKNPIVFTYVNSTPIISTFNY